jgi:hypothetical protein
MPSVVKLFMPSVVRQNVARLIVVAPNGGHPSKLTHRRTQLFFLILYLPFIVIPSIQSKLAAKQRSILSVCHFHPSLMFQSQGLYSEHFIYFLTYEWAQ